jgi:hypothetical protein
LEFLPQECNLLLQIANHLPILLMSEGVGLTAVLGILLHNLLNLLRLRSILNSVDSFL